MLKANNTKFRLLAFMLMVFLMMPYAVQAKAQGDVSNDFKTLQKLIPIAESKGIYVVSSSTKYLKDNPEIVRSMIKQINEYLAESEEETDTTNELLSDVPILRSPVYESRKSLRRYVAVPVSVTDISNPSDQLCLATVVCDYYCDEYIDRSSGSDVIDYYINSLSMVSSNLANENQFYKIFSYAQSGYSSVINSNKKLLTIYGTAKVTAQVVGLPGGFQKNYTGQYQVTVYAGNGYVLQYIN